MDFTAFRTMKPFAQLMFALFVMVASLFLFMVIGMIAVLPFYGTESLMSSMSQSSLNSPEGVDFLKYFQVVQSIGLFVAPPFAIGWLYHGNIGEYLKINRSTKGQSFFLAAICLLTVIPLINFLGAINSQMRLPESFSGLETWMKTMEDAAKLMTEKFLKADSFSGLMFNVFMIAVLPALGEELMFRGVIQRIFSHWTKTTIGASGLLLFYLAPCTCSFTVFYPGWLLAPCSATCWCGPEPCGYRFWLTL